MQIASQLGLRGRNMITSVVSFELRGIFKSGVLKKLT